MRRIQAGSALSAFGLGFTVPYLYVYVAQVRDLGAATAGVVLAVFAMAALVVLPFSGRAIDRRGPVPVLLVASVVAAVGAVAMGFASSVPAAVGAAALLGAGTAVLQPALATMIVWCSTPVGRTRAFAMQFFLQNLGLGVGGLIGLGPALLVTLMGSLISAALLTVVISRAVLGRPVSLGAAWQEARPRLLQLVGLTLLLAAMSSAIVMVGLLPGLLIGGAPGAALTLLGGLGALVAAVWLMIRFSLASPALMLERGGVFTSLKRSAKLVRGVWWRIFGITLLTQLLIFIFSMIIAIPFTVIGIAVDGDGFSDMLSGTSTSFGWPFLIVTGIGGVITSALTYPVSAGVTVLLYVDQRIRREALDLELARAAGIPGYGPAPGTQTVGG
ncbi:MFS transporter [Streptomyces sp. SID6041]|nr:MFS transporter [Streptomyces sp. SID6041]